MKATKKDLKRLRKELVPMLRQEYEPFRLFGTYELIPIYNENDIKASGYFGNPQTVDRPINHLRRLKTIIRSCSTPQRLMIELQKYGAKYQKAAQQAPTV